MVIKKQGNGDVWEKMTEYREGSLCSSGRQFIFHFIVAANP